MSDSPEDTTRLSPLAESLFFAHAEWSAEDWWQRLEAGEIDGEPLPHGVIGELKRLVAGLAHFADVPAGEQPVAAAGQGEPLQQTLEVMGRGGGSYQLLDRLGTGGHGMVYRGLQQAPLERLVAVKVYYTDGSGADSLEGIRELEAIRRLNHPGICELLDAGVTPWMQPFLVFQYIDGLPLVRHVQEMQLSCAERLQLFDEVLDAVGYSHEQGVVHRDLKPHNILVHRSSGRALLIDFGISRITEPIAADATTLTAAGSGTREYQSPEQAGWIDRLVDTRTDVYSLGCILFELLTEERAFPRDTADDTGSLEDRVHRHVHNVGGLAVRLQQALGDRFPEVSEQQRSALITLVTRCVRTLPEDRFQSVSDLRGHLAAVAEGRPTTLARSPRKSWRPLNIVLGGLAFFVLILAAGLACLGWRGGRQDTSRTQARPSGPAAAGGEMEAAGSSEGLLAFLRLAEKIAARSPTMRAKTAKAVATRILSAAAKTADDPVFAAGAAGEERGREAWFADVNSELGFLDPSMRREVGLLLTRQALEEGRLEICATLVAELDRQLGEAPNDLRARSDLLVVGLDECVVPGREQTTRTAAERLLGLLRQKGMLTTTEEGQRLAAAYADLWEHTPERQPQENPAGRGATAAPLPADE